MKFKTKEELAKYALKAYLKAGRRLTVPPAAVPAAWRKKRACFVTLYLKGNLRGCVGSCEVFEPLYQNIIRNTVNAALADWRFAPVTKDEAVKISVEVSVLSPLRELPPLPPEKLLTFLRENKPGVMLENCGQQALYLPQVWDQFADPADFLGSLCLKAGLPENIWQEKSTNYWTFTLVK